ncbi:hypothetical protein [Nocardioides sp.]|uniref:hypothetical protein n=1 Tax=Nocardioides sp. TaxID=35761 RepID=UPI002ED19C69
MTLHGPGARLHGLRPYGLIATIVVMVGIAVLILLFERRRAREIDAGLQPPRRGRPGDGQSPDE